MTNQPENRREMLRIEAIEPGTGELQPIHISHDRLMAVARRSLGHASEAAYIVPAILQKPLAIFQGLLG